MQLLIWSCGGYLENINGVVLRNALKPHKLRDIRGNIAAFAS
jgi:hypothetical protein